MLLLFYQSAAGVLLCPQGYHKKDLLSRFVGIWMVLVVYIAVCVEGAAYDATCSGSGAGDCSEANNICVAGTSKCACASTSFRKGGTECATKIVLKATCVVAETAPDQCVAGAECKDDGKGAKKCLCKTTHYESSANCVLRIVPGATCAIHQSVTNAYCNTTSTKCQCGAGYTATPTTKPSMCSGVNKVATLSYMLAVPILVSMMFLLR